MPRKGSPDATLANVPWLPTPAVSRFDVMRLYLIVNSVIPAGLVITVFSLSCLFIHAYICVFK